MYHLWISIYIYIYIYGWFSSTLPSNIRNGGSANIIESIIAEESILLILKHHGGYYTCAKLQVTILSTFWDNEGNVPKKPLRMLRFCYMRHFDSLLFCGKCFIVTLNLIDVVSQRMELTKYEKLFYQMVIFYYLFCFMFIVTFFVVFV